MTDVVAS